jgi:hypothetical protein
MANKYFVIWLPYKFSSAEKQEMARYPARRLSGDENVR